MAHVKYFIDFEACDEQTIISVGCICEDGREFYSLVYNESPISERIQEITGLKQEDILAAEPASTVFERFYDWCSEGIPDFYCYGSSDPDFCYNTLQNATAFKEAAILSYLSLNMKDYSERAVEHFHATQTISLERLGKHYDENMADQTHNALDDARLLKRVYEEIEGRPEERYIFKDYMGESHRRIRGQVLRIQGDEVIEAYDSIQEAAAWVQKTSGGSLSNIEEKIKRASYENIRYSKYKWRII